MKSKRFSRKTNRTVKPRVRCMTDFQAGLVKRLVVTANTLSTWQDVVGDILRETAEVLPVSFFFYDPA